MNMIIIPSCICSSLTPDAKQIAQAFQVPVSRVNWCSIIFSFIYPPMSFVAMKMYNEMRPSVVLKIASVNLFISGWFRMIAIIFDKFWPILVGYAWLSITYPMTLSAATIIANKWFNDKERALVTSMIGLSVPLGSIISFTMAGLVFTKNVELVQHDMYKLLWIQNGWITFVTIPFFFIIKDKPKNPPSLVATQEAEKRDFCASVGVALKNRSYVCLLITFGLIDGCFISFSDIISMIFSKWFSDNEIALFGTLTVVFGVVASMNVGIVL